MKAALPHQPVKKTSTPTQELSPEKPSPPPTTPKVGEPPRHPPPKIKAAHK